MVRLFARVPGTIHLRFGHNCLSISRVMSATYLFFHCFCLFSMPECSITYLICSLDMILSAFVIVHHIPHHRPRIQFQSTYPIPPVENQPFFVLSDSLFLFFLHQNVSSLFSSFIHCNLIAVSFFPIPCVCIPPHFLNRFHDFCTRCQVYM